MWRCLAKARAHRGELFGTDARPGPWTFCNTNSARCGKERDVLVEFHNPLGSGDSCRVIGSIQSVKNAVRLAQSSEADFEDCLLESRLGTSTLIASYCRGRRQQHEIDEIPVSNRQIGYLFRSNDLAALRSVFVHASRSLTDFDLLVAARPGAHRVL